MPFSLFGTDNLIPYFPADILTSGNASHPLKLIWSAAFESPLFLCKNKCRSLHVNQYLLYELGRNRLGL